MNVSWALSKKSIQNNMDLVTFDLFHQLNSTLTRLLDLATNPSRTAQLKQPSKGGDDFFLTYPKTNQLIN